MKDHRHNPSWEEHKNQGPRKKEEEGRGSVEEVGGKQTPPARLKDGTNDFQNGDQDDLGEASEKSSTGDESQTV